MAPKTGPGKSDESGPIHCGNSLKMFNAPFIMKGGLAIDLSSKAVSHKWSHRESSQFPA